MVVIHNVEGFDKCVELLESIEKGKKILLYFSGKKNEKGENWCPDCETAEPIVNEVIQEFSAKDFVFIHVSVGTRAEWKDPQSNFRTDQRFKLTSVPTLLLYNTVQRLNDVECQDKENIRLLLEDL